MLCLKSVVGNIWRIVPSLWKLSSEMAGTAARVGVCCPDTRMCHAAARTNNTLKGEKNHNSLKWEKTRQACNFSGKKVSLSGAGSRMVISRTALNHLGPQQPCPAPSPQVILPSAAVLGSFLGDLWPIQISCSHPIYLPTARQGGLEYNLLLPEGKRVCKGLLGTAMASGKEDRASLMRSFGCTNCMQNYLGLNHSKATLWFFQW